MVKKIYEHLVVDFQMKTQMHILTVPVLFSYTLPKIGHYAEQGTHGGFFL